MYKTFTSFTKTLRKTALALLIAISATNESNGQCPIGTAYLWSTLTPATPDVPVIATGTWKQNILDINVVSGRTYKVGNCIEVNGTNPSGASGTSVTVRDNTSATVIAWASGPNDACAIFTAPYTGVVRAYLYTDACANGTVSFTAGAVWVGCNNPVNLAASNITINSATVSWDPMPGSLGYEYVVDQNPGNPSGSGTLVTATSANLTGLTLNTTYYLHVRVICAAASSQWVTTSFKTLTAYCLPPATILFPNVTYTSADMIWSKMPNSTSYEYTMDLTPNPVLAKWNLNIIPTTGFTASLTGLKPETKYYVFVRSFCLNGADSSWWVSDSFITKGICLPVDPKVENQGTNNPTVRWNAVHSRTEGAYEYRVTNSIDTPAFGTETLDTFATVTLDPDGQAKYMHIRTKCNSQFKFSEWRTVQLRTTGVTTTEHNVDIQLYPNPVKGRFTVEMSEVNKNAQLQLSDVAGRLLKTLLVEGNKTIINTADLQPGIYMLRYDDGIKHQVFRITKQ
jgi:hypothetical protein